MPERRKLARHLPGRKAHYPFTARDNRKTLRRDIQLPCDGTMGERAPDFAREPGKPEHGRLERRPVRVSSEINEYAEFPGVGQVFAVRRGVTQVRTGERSAGTAYGVTSPGPGAAAPKRLPGLNRGHWRIEANHHIPGRSFDGDRSRIRTGHGPENTTLPPRFAIGPSRPAGSPSRRRCAGWAGTRGACPAS